MESVRTVEMWVELPTKIASVKQRSAVIRNWVVVGKRFLENVPDTPTTHALSDYQLLRL